MKNFGVGRIDFINTAPVYYGMDIGRVQCPGREVKGPPSTLNRLLRTGEIQISAISSVAYAQAYPQWLLLPSLSISARGPVQSVLLCLHNPYDAGVLKGAEAMICTCGDALPSLEAAAQILAGRFKPTARLPVPLQMG